MELSKILSYTNQVGDCLEWTRCFNTDGYPRMGVKGNSNIKVHRLVMSLVSGEDIGGRVVRHKCDNPKCINPDHLLLGTVKDNVADMDNRGRRSKKITGPVVVAVQDLLATGKFQQKEIADLINIDPRRVSDISNGLYTNDGKLKRYLVS